ncbi:MAG: hypothetical protein ACREIP_04345 [Alphaproteobacteria bacterium]
MAVSFPSRLKRCTAALAAVMIMAAPAHAACTQDRAVYTDRDDDYTLRFRPLSEDQPDAASSEFSLERNDGDLKLDGVIMREGDAIRPNGLIMFQCPGGDATGDELRACTVWQGVLYALKEGAEAEFLPRAKEPAAQALLLPDLSASMSAFDFKRAKPLETFPWDVFRFKECTPEQ